MTSVTFPPAIGGSGATYSDDDNPITGMKNGGYRVRFFPMVSEVVAVADGVRLNAQAAAASAAAVVVSASTQATVAGSLTVGAVGATLNFTLDQTGKLFSIGQWVLLSKTSDSSVQMAVRLTAFNSGTGVASGVIQYASGSGAHSGWTVALTSAGGIPSNRSITGGGLATGGGDLSANRVITVTAADTSGYWNGNGSSVVTPSTIWIALLYQSLVDAATIAVDMNLAGNFQVTLGGNRTLGNPTNQLVGQSGTIKVSQDGTGGRTLAFASNWKRSGGAPTITPTAGAADYIKYEVVAIGTILYDVIANPT